jgi:hypothetical protein
VSRNAEYSTTMSFHGENHAENHVLAMIQQQHADGGFH